MAYSINSVLVQTDGKIALRMFDPVTQQTFVTPLPSVKAGLPTLIMVVHRRPTRRKRRYG